MKNLPGDALLNGPTSIPPAATHLLICLHGFGADGHDLASLARPLQAALAPHGLVLGVACPHAPTPTPMGQGRQWFRDMGWTFRDKEGLAVTQQQLWHYLEHLHQQTGIPYAQMVILGFSQGAMSAIYSAPRWPAAVGSVIAVAGVAMWQEELNRATCQQPPFLFIHGADDDIVPADASVQAAAGLEQLGFTTRLEILAGLGHGIDNRVLGHVVVWLTELFGQQG